MSFEYDYKGFNMIILHLSSIIICGSWFCVKNKQKENYENKPEYKVLPVFKWSEKQMWTLFSKI